jgi:hypothetical protein
MTRTVACPPGQRAQVNRPQPVIGRQHQLRRHHVSPIDRTWCHGGRAARINAWGVQRHRLDVFDHSTALAQGEAVAGIDRLVAGKGSSGRAPGCRSLHLHQ